jgi:RNA polymerase sigma-70 factor (ECF subfamily)
LFSCFFSDKKIRGMAELSSQEAGHVLGWTENKVNVTFFRAMKKLNERLKEGEYFGQFVGKRNA